MKNSKILKFVILSLGLILCLYWQYGKQDQYPQEQSQYKTEKTTSVRQSDARLQEAYKKKQNDLQIGGVGRVIKILPDDLKGSRHQKFLLKLATGQTLLVAHNIDLAPRVKTLQLGDRVEFYGEYEWSEKGGVIHWTHSDPRGHHKGGWLIHKGEMYK